MKEGVDSFFQINSALLLQIYNSKLNLHTPVYSREDMTPAVASNYLNYLLTLECEKFNCKKIVDIGSGLGGSLIYLSNNSMQRNDEFVRREEFKYYGITCLEVEVREALNNFSVSGCDDMCKAFCGDFEDIKFYKLFHNADLIFCFESLSYANDLENTIKNISENLKDDGIFLLADYFDIQTNHNIINSINKQNFEDLVSKYFQIYETVDFSQKCKLKIKKNKLKDLIKKALKKPKSELEITTDTFENISKNLSNPGHFLFYKMKKLPKEVEVTTIREDIEIDIQES